MTSTTDTIDWTWTVKDKQGETVFQFDVVLTIEAEACTGDSYATFEIEAIGNGDEWLEKDTPLFTMIEMAALADSSLQSKIEDWFDWSREDDTGCSYCEGLAA